MEIIRNNILLKTFLILLHIGFYVGNTAFIHTHHYLNYSVTHSHPFSKTSEGTPDHTHDKAALDTIAQFNSFSIDIILFLSLGIASILLFTFIQRHSSHIVLRTVNYYNLRAPPAFYL
ncbi:MAG: hypothetical protein LBQ60_02315 [Bacteroidales bacterium]|nr:hypothetical protein [Bacteroidales bacterium]